MGATLVRRLAGSGHSVRVFDNYSTGNPAYLDGVGAELVEGDIRDAAALDAALAGIESVVHLAAAGSVVMSVADPVMNFEANVLGTFRVLDAARRAGLERVVLASTGRRAHRRRAAPGQRVLAAQADLAVRREQARRGRVRARLRQVLRAAHGGAAVRQRLRAMERAQEGRDDRVLPGAALRPADRDLRGRHSSRDYTHVDDIAHALQLALEGDVPGGTVLHIASGVETTITELADLCRSAAGQPDHPVEYQPRRVGEVDRNFATYDLAKQVLGYTPAIAREDGIAQTWDWYQEHVFRS